MAQVLRTSEAKQDLIDILTYLGLKSPAAADRVGDEIDQKCQLLAQLPHMGASREDLAPGLRSFPVGKYNIYYRPVDDGIEVVRVLHGARNIPSFFQP